MWRTTNCALECAGSILYVVFIKFSRLFEIVVVHAPAQIADSGFVHRARHLGKIGGNVVFKALLANQPKQFRYPWNSSHTGAAKGLQRIVGELPLSNISPDLAVEIVGGK